MANEIYDFYVTGDIHGQVNRFYSLEHYFADPKKPANIIVLGDFGVNFNDPSYSKFLKSKIQNPGINYYVVRGNHEHRPQDIPDMQLCFDEKVNGYVMYEEAYPNIRYFLDVGEYFINGHPCLVMGGAYSVDKEWRLESHNFWEPKEQLNKDELEYAKILSEGKFYDFIFTHTCPYSFRPTEMFLDFIDESKVDNSMENAFEEIAQQTHYEHWCFGHYHTDRAINDKASCFYRGVSYLEDLLPN